MTAFARVLIAPKPVGGRLPAPAKACIADVHQVVPQLHRALLQCSDLIDCHMTLAGREISAIWLPSGQTAGVVFLGRVDVVEAVCVLVSGLDGQEDDHAIARAGQACQTRSWGEIAVPRNRPLLAMAFGSTEAYADRALSTAAVAWALAFFAMLGVGEPELSESPPS